MSLLQELLVVDQCGSYRLVAPTELQRDSFLNLGFSSFVSDFDIRISVYSLQHFSLSRKSLLHINNFLG
jgi:hypothetical protein